MAVTLIVEDGTGIVDANSYISEAEYLAYWTNRGNATAIAITGDPLKSLLIQATDYIEIVYYGLWQGERLTTTQALEFPRIIDSVDVGVPERLKKACCELAYTANSGALLTDVEQRIVKEKVAVIETTYSEYSDQLTQYTTVYGYISEYLENSSLNSSKVVRT